MSYTVSDDKSQLIDVTCDWMPIKDLLFTGLIDGLVQNPLATEITICQRAKGEPEEVYYLCITGRTWKCGRKTVCSQVYALQKAAAIMREMLNDETGR